MYPDPIFRRGRRAHTKNLVSGDKTISYLASGGNGVEWWPFSPIKVSLHASSPSYPVFPSFQLLGFSHEWKPRAQGLQSGHKFS